MQEEFYKKIQTILSVERLGSYGEKDNAEQCTVLSRYLWNMAICESLYSPLQLFEVGLRNAIHNRLKCLFGDNWYEDSAFPLTDWGAVEVDKVKKKIFKHRKIETPGLVISELQFGFWTHMFEHHYEDKTKFLPKSIKYVFPGLSKSKHNRKNIKYTLEEIRGLRNKVFHHERIVYWQDLVEKHKTILEVIRWMSPELYEMALALDRFTEIYEQGINPWIEKIRYHWAKDMEKIR